MNVDVKINILKQLIDHEEAETLIRVYESAIAAIEYCNNNGLTYYIEDKKWE